MVDENPAEKDTLELLQAEIKRLREELEGIKQEFEEDMKRMFSSLSHEFKTPLSTIRLSATYLAKYWNRLEPAAIDEKLKIIVEQTDNLVHSVENIVSKRSAVMQKMEVSRKCLDVEDFFRKLINNFKEKFPAHEIEYRQHLASPTAELDEDLCQNIFQNIIGNALLYSPEREKIGIKVMSTTSELIVEVSDRGIGIPEADQGKIYESFYRGSNVGDIKGMGLGLSIAKRATDAMQGTIEAKSKPSEGSIFKITIPMAKDFR